MNDEYPPLGFGPLPTPLRVFVGQEQGPNIVCGWYRLDASDRRIAIEEPALTGYVRALHLVPKHSERHGDSLKLDITIQADKPYIVRSGIETKFSRDVILALNLIDNLDKPITIAAVPGDESKTVFARVYQSGTLIFTERDDRSDLPSIAQKVANKLGQASIHANGNGHSSRPATPTGTGLDPSSTFSATVRTAPAQDLRPPAPARPTRQINDRDRMSQPGQHAELQRLAGLRGWSTEFLDAESESRYHYPHTELTFSEAINFIGRLKQEAQQ